MSRYKRYVPGLDVVTAARARFDRLYATFDSVVVSFSGGKDSQVCVNLAREAAERAGRLPVDVVFVDEELIPDNVIELVEHYRQQDWVRLRWYGVPMKLSKFILGKTVEFHAWDPAREPVRPLPECAIRPAPGDDRAWALENMSELIIEGYPGRVAQVVGLRAQESYKRYRGLVAKIQDNWIAEFATDKKLRGLALTYPIYDWTENDVMKWLRERGIPWAAQYDMQHLAGMNLRVSTPLHPESAKRFHFHRLLDPAFYERIIKIFPEMQLQERYYREYDPSGGTSGGADPYLVDGFDGGLRYIRDHYTEPEKRKLAMQGYRDITRAAQKGQDWAHPKNLLDWLRGGSVHVPIRMLKGRKVITTAVPSTDAPLPETGPQTEDADA